MADRADHVDRADRAPRHKKEHTIKDEWTVVEMTKAHSQKEIAAVIGYSQQTVLKIQRRYHLVLSFGQCSSSAMFRERNKAREFDVVALEMLDTQIIAPDRNSISH